MEGPVKTDVIHTLTGMTVLAVPGVNALTQLQKALEVLREEGVRKIKPAFDMDMAPTSTSQTATVASLRFSARWASTSGPTSGTNSTRARMTSSGKVATIFTIPNKAQARKGGDEV